MTTLKDKGNKFYQNLGKLFYAIAMADKTVQPIEIQRLKEDVKKYWVPLDDVEDEFGTDAAYQIEIVFDWLHQEEADSQSCYIAFVDFFRNNLGKFSPEIRDLIWKTADGIAFSFSGKNKSELVLLAKLKLLLQGSGE